ncbi:unnamed protein product [Mycena citricolor]|uniref:Uncharacterized protein n=1 Tax=Mycena citricolor TaxID=2018698 RepID=A0AAD2H296_9AGAR|nr:unnamed protein product [Mycena citricolor]
MQPRPKALKRSWTSHYGAIYCSVYPGPPQFTCKVTIDGPGTPISARPTTSIKQASRRYSFTDLEKIITLLAVRSTERPSFRVIGIRLPGHGFSEAWRKKRFPVRQAAELDYWSHLLRLRA